MYTNMLHSSRRVWGYQRGNQNPEIRRTDKTMAKRKRTNNDLQSITKDRVTWIPLKTGGELMCSGRVSSSCSTSGNPFIHRFKQYPTTLHLNSGKNNKIYKEYTYIVSEYEMGRNVRLTEQYMCTCCVPSSNNTWYNIMWYSLSVTFGRSVVFSWYSGFFLKWP